MKSVRMMALLRLVAFVLVFVAVLSITVYERINYGAANAFVTFLSIIGVLVAPVMYTAYRDACKRARRGERC